MRPRARDDSVDIERAATGAADLALVVVPRLDLGDGAGPLPPVATVQGGLARMEEALAAGHEESGP